MDKAKEIQMKQHVLGMLHDFMMTGEGGKFKPKAIEVEMISEPEEGDDKDLGEFLEKASADAPDMDKEEKEEPKRMSPKEFFKRK